MNGLNRMSRADRMNDLLFPLLYVGMHLVLVIYRNEN